MEEHQSDRASTSRPLNKAIWLEALDALEREFLVFQQKHAAPMAGEKASEQLEENLRI
jgi:hypothetical protein